jgi:hypothetical protein
MNIPSGGIENVFPNLFVMAIPRGFAVSVTFSQQVAPSPAATDVSDELVVAHKKCQNNRVKMVDLHCWLYPSGHANK